MKNKITLSIISICLNVILIVTLYTLPSRISKEVNGIDTKSTNKIIEYKSEKLETKSEFVYFDGTVIGSPTKLSDRYSYDAAYPECIFNGYISLAQSKNGAKYYIFRNDSISFKNTEIKGYFFIDNISRFQVEKDLYTQILYPVIRKQ